MSALESLSQSVLTEVEYDLALVGVENPWSVTALRMTEAISEPWECVVEVATDAPAPKPSMLLGLPASIVLRRSPLSRHASGLVVSVQDEGTSADLRVFELTIVPELWLLGQRSHWRIFQDLDAVAVVRRVLADAGIYPGDGLLDLVPSGTTTPRECRTQFGETDLAFVRRVLDDEGLAFAFVHDGEHERLVIFDPGAVQTLARVPTLDGGPAPVLGDAGATASVESVYRVDSVQAVSVAAVSLRDHDFTRPFAPIATAHPHASPPSGRTRYEYPARFNYGRIDANSGSHPPPATSRAALVRHQALTAAAGVVRGTATVTGLRAGALVDLDEDAERDLDGRFLVTRVTHVGHCPEALLSAPASRGEARYCNHFELLPLSRTYRTTPAPRPQALAPQCAIVTATPGSHDEVCTDRLGRVLVRFPWDDHPREPNAQSSCWLRVSLPWAGAATGVSFVPRVGMEVVVQFLDGDPDRPFVVGCLHNPANAPPIELPSHRTRSVIRTQSVPVNGGYNELMFEDLAGREEVSLRAQRDLNEHVLRDHHTRVGAARVSTVGANAYRTVGGDDVETVHGTSTVTVDRDTTRTVRGAERVDIGGRLAITVRRAATVHVNQTHALTADEGAHIAVGGSATVDVLPDDITLAAPSEVTLRCGGSTMTLTPDTATLDAPATVVLRCGASTITLDPGAITLTTGGTSIHLDGSNVTVTATGPVTVTGSTVDLNS